MDYFKYLRSWITSDGRSDRDIRCRIGQEKQAFMDMRNLLRARSLGLGAGKRLLKKASRQCYCMDVSHGQ